MEAHMLVIVTLHFVAAALAPVLVRRIERRAFWVLALIPFGSFLWLLAPAQRAFDGDVRTERIPWIPTIDLHLDFALTPLNAVMALIVTGVGALVLAYCRWYFREGDLELWRFSAVLTGFAGSMLGLVVSDNLYILFVFWELTTILSFLLIGHNPERKANRRAAMNALIVTTFGGLVMLIGLFLLGHEAGTARVSEILADPPQGTTTTIAVLLILVGAISKSALVPFHFWLPGAMAAPTPVSAYLHAAAMVKAGVFLVALLAPAFSDIPGWRPLLLATGTVTMIIGGLRALRQYDIKLLLAYGTVSQLGFLIAVVGAGTRAATFAGLALVLGHALFKSTLFLVVGVIDRATGTRDLRELTGLYRSLPVLFVAAVLAAASMAGLPPLLGFTAKEAALAAYLDLGHDADLGAWGVVALVGLVVGATLTVAYTARFVWGAFGVRNVEARPVTPQRVGFVVAPVLLAGLSLVGGFAGGFLTPRLMAYAGELPSGAHAPQLTLWHGFTPALGLSALAIAGGLLLWIGRRAVASAQRRVVEGLHLPEAEVVYHAIIRGVDRLSIEVTGRTQRGSLPVYVGIILVVLVTIPGIALVQAWDEVNLRGPDNLLQVAIVLVVSLAAVMTVRSRRRLRAVLLLGITGYGTALLFVAHGAPDLALTQVLVETFSVVTFVLVMRRLPPFFSSRPFTAARRIRVAVGVLVGLAVGGYALVAANARTARPVGEEFAGPAHDYGGGNNIVNVTLVDIRVWDTFGEISVLVVAATGVASLIFLLTDRATSHRETRRKRVEASPGWLRGAGLIADRRRSVVFEIVTRIVFPVLMIFSIYLTFAGHNLPGGGFAGGLIAGLALMVRYLAGGRAELDSAAPIDAGAVLGGGLVIAAVSGIVPALLGHNAFQSGIFDVPTGLFGYEVHLVTSLFFDLGVYLVVVGLSLDVLRSLGGGIDKQGEESGEVDTDTGEVAIA
ncbi:Na+/H+ antiporter subunit A [Knoellia subterranea]|uniref:Cation:proton antiporter n=1 Tax=Knoellia subterranea KCTC 19937 TaxID=1385521 RepID=A0A0A0JQ19_9MICO|nr:Na+/H+ antiporter subunit A [Knoellia subterranea]KGN37701.1 cation:proton antiporter [Knoellia subterranea KCTC 19937]